MRSPLSKFVMTSKFLQSYVQYGSPKMFMKKSDSERALVAQDRLIHKQILVKSDGSFETFPRRDSSTSTSTTSSATRVNSAQPRAPAVATSVKKSGDRRRFKRSLTMNSIPVIVSEKVDSNMIRVPPPRPSEGGDGDGTEGSATKFTIGTSDEDDLVSALRVLGPKLFGTSEVLPPLSAFHATYQQTCRMRQVHQFLSSLLSDVIY